MLDLYAALGVTETADTETLAAAISRAEQEAALSAEQLLAARRFLLDEKKRAEYDRSLRTARELGQGNTQLTRAAAPLAKRAALPAVPHQTSNANTAVLPNRAAVSKMKKRHWLALIVCLTVTAVLVTALWQMAQVQLYQNQQITALQQMTAERRLPEDWPTWEQLDGETFLTARENRSAKLTIYKNATQDLPVMLLPSKQRIDCGLRGNQSCRVKFVFDGGAAQEFDAQIIGSSLVFNDNTGLPYLMQELSRTSSVYVAFPQADIMPPLTFERHLADTSQEDQKAPPKTKK